VDIHAVCGELVDDCNRRQDREVRNCQARARSNYEACARWAQQNRQDVGRTCDGHRRGFDQCRNDSQRRELACHPRALGCPTRERGEINFQLCMRNAAAAQQQSRQPPPRAEPPPEAPRARPATRAASAPREHASPTAMRLGEELLSAARRRNAEQVERLIRDGAAVNVQDRDGRTPRHLAAASGSAIIAELLIRGGASVLATTPSPLFSRPPRGEDRSGWLNRSTCCLGEFSV